MSAPHWPGLDALRGAAVLVVFVSHAANDGMLPGWLGQGSGQMGVQLFFALSGFLMARLYGGRACDGAEARRFAVARAARIVPLYAVVLAVSLLAASLGGTPHYRVASGAEALAAALFLAAPQELWSIPVEVQFYIFFLGLWRLGLVRPGPLAAAACLSLPLAAAWRGALGELPVLPPFLPIFLLGAWLGTLPERHLRPMAHPAALPLAVLAFAACLPGIRAPMGLELWQGWYPSLWLDPFRLAACMALLAAASAAVRAPGPLVALGRVSFAVYLVHRPVLRALAEGGAEGPLAALAALGISLGLAALSLRLLERPAALAIRAAAARRPRPAPRSA